MSSHHHFRNPLKQVATTLRELRARHAERHRPSGFQFAFADRTDFLNEAAWDAVAANGSLFVRRDVLRVIEQHGIWRGCKSLWLGHTALEPKAALGAKPEPMSVWLRHRVPAMNWILRGVLGAETHEAAPERNPFKAGGHLQSNFSTA